jgi:hypothetical protein
MNIRGAILGALILAVPAAAFAQMSPAPMMPATAAPAQAPLSPAEKQFYKRAKMLRKIYPTPADAEKAGWFRFNNEDETGAISYINPKYYDTPDPWHPQQLWYDVKGRLLGGDFSQLVATHPAGPDLFGIDRSRFSHARLHIHFGLKRPDGTVEYGVFVTAQDFIAGHLDPLHPTAADLVTLGKIKSASEVAFIFPAQENWDATMWLIKNPAGQFADKNPDVTPSADQGKTNSERRL